MPLQEQTIPIVFASGVDTKTDPHALPPGAMLQAQNIVFTNPGEFQLRPGFKGLSQVQGDGSLISGSAALAVADQELLLLDGKNAFSFLSGANGWASKGNVQQVACRDLNVAASSYNQFLPSGATMSGTTVYAWHEGKTLGISYSVWDEAGQCFAVSQGIVASDLSPSSSITSPKVIPLGNQLVILYARPADSFTGVGGDIRFRTVYPQAPTVLNPEQTAFANATWKGGQVIDAIVSGSCAFVGWTFSSNGSTMAAHLGVMTSSGGNVDPIAGSSITVSPTGSVVSALAQDSANGIYVLCNSVLTGTNAPIALRVSSSLPVQSGYASGSMITGHPSIPDIALLAAFEAVPAIHEMAGLVSIRIVSNPNTPQPGGQVTNGSNDDQSYVWTNRFNSLLAAGSATSGTYLFKGNQLAAKPFLQGGTWYVPAVHDSQLQPQYFLYDYLSRPFPTVPGQLFTVGWAFDHHPPVARFREGTGGGAMYDGNPIPGSPIGSLSQPFNVSPTQWKVPLPVKEQLLSVNGTFYSVIATGAELFDFSPIQPAGVWLDGTFYGNGGFGQVYDGSSFSEHNFHLYPEQVINTATSTGIADAQHGIGGGSGSIQWCALYATQDAQGRTIRSQPSLPMTITRGNGYFGITGSVSTLRATSRPFANVWIEAYRTVPLGQTFYMVTDPLNPIYNDPTTDTVLFRDAVSNDALISNQILYTNGSLPFTPMPGGTISCIYQNRVFTAGGSLDPNQIVFSNVSVPGQPLTTNASNTIQVDSDGGPITAFGVLDDKLIIFKRDSYFFISGPGPSAAGGQGYSNPVKVTTDVGCVSQASVLTIPPGLAFKSAKGIYLLDRSLLVTYVGAPVEAYNGLTITGAQLLNDRTQARFTTKEGPGLAYDYYTKQWSTFTSDNALGSVIWQEQYTMLKPSGSVWVETPGSYLDSGSSYPLLFQTAWQEHAGPQGYQRVRAVQFLGTYVSPHSVSASIGYDYSPVFTQNKLISSTVLSGSYQFRIRPSPQKNQAYSVLIQTTGSNGLEPARFSSMVAKVGIKKGPRPIGDTRKF